jgi:tetratricopeptide (TPR) repeat protein
MVNRIAALLIIMAAGIIGAAAAQSAPPAQSSGKICVDVSEWVPERRAAIVSSFKSPHIADGCFAAMVSSLINIDKKILDDSLVSIFSARSPKNRFTVGLLFSLYRIKPLSGDAALWGRVIDIWAASSREHPSSVAASYSEGGGIPTADTLYGALDAAGRLDAHELLRYGRIKSLSGDYRAAAAIFCRAAADKRVEHAAVTQMEQLLSDADSAAMVAALRAFRRCALSHQSSDTAFYRNRLADFCGRHGLFDEEISILKALDIPTAPAGRKLADAAKSHFARRRYRLSAAAAVAAHGRLDSADAARPAAALTAYQAYTQLKIRDSALVWLRLSGAAGKDAKIQAAALNQETGHLGESARIIDSLPTSLPKDTLAVRQYVFLGEMGKALNHIAAATTPSWVMSPRERLLWRARCLIFSARPYDAAPALDSLKFMANWHGAAEVLRYKYWIQRLDGADVPQGLAEAWGQLEHRVYTGDLDAAMRGLKESGLARGGGPGEALAVRLAGALMSSSRHQEALAALELVQGGKPASTGGAGGINLKTDIKLGGSGGNKANGPEYLYVYAEALNELGRRDEARAAAQKILAEYPADVFAQKARILLAKI